MRWDANISTSDLLPLEMFLSTLGILYCSNVKSIVISQIIWTCLGLTVIILKLEQIYLAFVCLSKTEVTEWQTKTAV